VDAALWLLMLAMAVSQMPPAQGATPTDAPTVGIAARIDQIVLPGSELVVRAPRERDQPLVLRIVETYPHGSAFRYDMIYYALEPGTYDLREHLERKDGTSTGDLPPIPVTVRAGLPPGQIEPTPPERLRIAPVGGYRGLLTAAGVLWLAGLVILYLRTRGRRAKENTEQSVAAPTVAERLKPLVLSARGGTLQPEQRAELERLLIGFWTERLGLQDLAPAQALARMRLHPEAGRLLNQLEAWLHRPADAEAVDVGAMLEPYAGVEGLGEAQGSAGGERKEVMA
jgi:hypothetical protein